MVHAPDNQLMKSGAIEIAKNCLGQLPYLTRYQMNSGWSFDYRAERKPLVNLLYIIENGQLGPCRSPAPDEPIGSKRTHL